MGISFHPGNFGVYIPLNKANLLEVYLSANNETNPEYSTSSPNPPSLTWK